MKLGLGLYRHMLIRENFQFARQAGATHVVAHLVDYFRGNPDNPNDNQPTGGDRGWIGDNPFIFLDTKKIQATGWTPKLTIEQGIVKTLRWLETNLWVYESKQ